MRSALPSAALCALSLLLQGGIGAAAEMPVRVSWGHQTVGREDVTLRFLTSNLAVKSIKPLSFEPGDRLEAGVVRGRAGGGDVDGVELRLEYPVSEVNVRTNIQSIWQYLLAHSDPETVNRLRSDPGFRPDSRKLTFQLNTEGTFGFSLTIDQLLKHKCFWVKDAGIFISAGSAETFAEHEQLCPRSGQRVLDQVLDAPEASYQDFTKRWEDMGSPEYKNPNAPEPGHIVCVSWDSAIPKFGIDRFAGVRNDLGNPDHFSCALELEGQLGEPPPAWKQQRLTEGLPVLVTVFESRSVAYRIEQFAYPLHGSPHDRRGDIAMVLLQKLTLTSLDSKEREVPFTIRHSHEMAGRTVEPVMRNEREALIYADANSGSAFVSFQGHGFQFITNVVQKNSVTGSLTFRVSLAPNEERSMVIKLPSPALNPAEVATLLALDYTGARTKAISYWTDHLDRGARFDVPEPAVNELFRANLWHALRLPRRHSAEGDKIDLPYSNFAYGQNGTPWPVNQAVYVDYMLYDLRGYHDFSVEELGAMFRNNQEPNGHVGGYANWGVYTPGMLYAVAQKYLLSGDHDSFEKLLPQTLKALDWCLSEVNEAAGKSVQGSALVLAPLNDLSHEPQAWAFNQAYLYAGIELLGRALAEINHPRAADCRLAAERLRQATEHEFGRAAMQAPAVQLRDGSWSPYVPSDALSAGRLPAIWYPTDVDCGPLHLSRLKALPAQSPLTTAMLHDHEDNLFINGWGMANEPVYNQQATTYLLRDEPKLAIRSFYSMMACAFSHSTFEPVEHRWGWGQYFGPPSTDGAWFDLYRHMLIHERDDGSLLLLQATPRAWLQAGKQILVERAPTYYGRLTMSIQSRQDLREISAKVHIQARKQPAELLVRFRHAEQKPMRSVRINGRTWTDFDAGKEWVRIRRPSGTVYDISARY